MLIPAAQFLTLSLSWRVATEVIVGDLDGPGHVPFQLYVRPHAIHTSTIIGSVFGRSGL